MRPPSVDHRRHVRRGRRTRSGAEEEEEVRPHLDRAAGGQATGMAAWGLLLLPVVATICLALDEAEQRPLPIELGITESIVMTDRDELYVSPSVQYFRLPDQRRFTFRVETAYGFTDRLQLVMQVPYVVTEPDDAHATSGLGDVAVESRYALVNYRDHPFGLDVGLGLTLPTGDRRRDLGD